MVSANGSTNKKDQGNDSKLILIIIIVIFGFKYLCIIYFVCLKKLFKRIAIRRCPGLRLKYRYFCRVLFCRLEPGNNLD